MTMGFTNSSYRAQLRVEPTELLGKVPFFDGIPAEEFENIAALMKARTVAKYEDIIRRALEEADKRRKAEIEELSN